MKIIFTLTTCLICLNLSGQLITDRPDQTESSSTVPLGALQIESGIVITYTSGQGIFSEKDLLAPTTLFRYGLGKHIELRLLSQFQYLDFGPYSFTGISDLEIGSKIQLFKREDSNTEIAFLTHLLVPNGVKELSNDEYATINKLSISHVLNDNSSVGYNLGYNYFGIGKGDITYSIALGRSVNEKLGIYIEPYGELSNMDEFILNFDSGFTYLLSENLQLDFSFGTGINQRMNYLSIGISWLVERDKK